MNQTEPVTFRKNNTNRQIRISKTGNAAHTIGTITPGQDTYILNYGQFSLIAAIVTIIHQIGPAHATISTWTSDASSTQPAAELILSAQLQSFTMLVDSDFPKKQPLYCHQMLGVLRLGGCLPGRVFLSCEPLLGPVDLGDLRGIGWVIAGGESGPNARAMDDDWVRGIRDQCVAAGVPFFFKQRGGRGKGAHDLPVLDGRVWNEVPR